MQGYFNAASLLKKRGVPMDFPWNPLKESLQMNLSKSVNLLDPYLVYIVLFWHHYVSYLSHSWMPMCPLFHLV